MQTPDIRPFSSLTVKYYEALNKGAKGMIKVDQQELLKKGPLDVVPEWFWSSQTSYRSCLSRRMDMGVRNIIGNVLVAAVEIARGLFDDPRLTMHSEWDVPVTEVPDWQGTCASRFCYGASVWRRRHGYRTSENTLIVQIF